MSDTVAFRLFSTILFVLSSLFLLFDFAWVVLPIAGQVRSYSYSSVSGQVKESELTVFQQDQRHQKVYGFQIAYVYRVNDKEFEGSQRRYGFDRWHSLQFPDEFVRSHPRGKKVEVYFNPVDPSDAVLVRGLEGVDLFCPLFLLPFNIVLFFCWWEFLAAMRRWWYSEEIVIPDKSSPRRRINYFIIWAVFFALGAAIVSWGTALFVGFDVSIWFATFEWLVVIILSTSALILIDQQYRQHGVK